MSERIEELLEFGGLRGRLAAVAVSGIALALHFAAPGAAPFDWAWIAVALCGLPIVAEAVAELLGRFNVKTDLLVATALVAASATGDVFAAGEVALIMQLGELLEEYVVERARSGVERLARLAQMTARIVGHDGAERVVPAAEVREGDLLRVNPGEAVPADGVVRTGTTSVDESSLTGEPVPVDRGPGDSVLGGSVNRFGAFDMVATRAGGDSAVARMARLVAEADAGKAKVVRLADRIATWVVAGAFLTAIACWGMTGEARRAVAILVVFCPCGLVLATPAAVSAAIGNATRSGFLVREGDAIERLAGVAVAAFDKTGTLTVGEPRVVAVGAADGVFRCVGGAPLRDGGGSAGPTPGQRTALSLAAAAESRSEHPLGKAIVRAASELGVAVPDAVEGFEAAPGRGVRAMVGGRTVAVGSSKAGDSFGSASPMEAAAAELEATGATVVRISVDGEMAGFAALSDTVRDDAAEAVDGIRGAGMEPVLLTGDREAAARVVAERLGIRRLRSGCLPEDKLAFVAGEERAGRPVCMVGDGVNDAPALRSARVGIAVGRSCGELAAEAADIVLVRGGLAGLPHLFDLARRTRRAIAFNIAFSLGVNAVAVALAAAGAIGAVAGALVHNGGAFLVVANSARLLFVGQMRRPRNPRRG